MKKLSTLLLFAFIAIFSSQSYAQIIAVQGGLNLSNMMEKDDDETYSDDYNTKPGFHLGVTAEFPLSDANSFQTGLLVSTKGMKIDESDDFGSYEVTANLVYLEIPLLFKKSFELNGGNKFFGAVGPYIGYGVAGTIKSKVDFMGETEEDEEDINWGSDDEDDIKPFDFGLSIGAGLEVNSFLFGISYDYGLANMAIDTDNGYMLQNRVIKFSLGYLLNGSN
jgi:opacity protein-like surface antigen